MSRWFRGAGFVCSTWQFFTCLSRGLSIVVAAETAVDLRAEELFQPRRVETVFESDAGSIPMLRSASLNDSASSFVSSMLQIVDESASRNQAGLLGRAYVDGQYISLVTPKEFEGFGDTMPGFRTSLNLPAPWQSQLPSFLFQDVFLSARHLGMSGTIDVFGTPLGLETEVDNWVIGTTVFTNFDSAMRPFVQLGYDCQTLEIGMTGNGQTFREKDHESDIFCAPGIEVDITSDVAFRFATELDFEEMESSVMTSELIVWMTRNVFVRGGLINDAEWEAYGGLIGGGLAY